MGKNASDICIASRTGSGKTLTFVLPVLQALRNASVRKLRCLVLLPTRDLVSQVAGVFEQYAPALGLRVGVCVGQTSLSEEQKQLCGPAILRSPEAALVGACYTTESQPPESLVDILVATPGRLMDHLGGTPGFTLQHLKFLVVDEADKLMSQQYSDWIRRIE